MYIDKVKQKKNDLSISQCSSTSIFLNAKVFYPTTNLMEKNLKITKAKILKQIVKNNSKKHRFPIQCTCIQNLLPNCNKFYIGETSRNLNERIYEHKKKNFKTVNTTNCLVSHNILTNYTFVFQYSAIFAFIHDKNKRRIIEACSIETPQHNTTMTRFFFFKISPSIGKIILKEFKIHTKD